MKFYTYICFIFLYCNACRDDNMPTPDTILPERTLIAYLCGDNNLSSEIDMKINALQQGMQSIGETVNQLIVYADYNNKMPELLQITSTGKTILEHYVEMNSASAANFSRIMENIMHDFPSESYGLICFSHASGWLPTKALNNPSDFATADTPPLTNATSRSIFEDEKQEMSIQDFAAAIPLTPSGEKLEFILFETCYMAGVEVAYELRDKTKYILSSAAEMLSTGLVEIYPTHLSDLFTPEPRLTAFAQAYFDHWNSQSGASRSATVSLIDLSGIEDLAKTVKAIYTNQQAVNISNIQHFNRNAYHLFFDLSDYMEAVATPEQKTAYENALSKVVVYQAATPQFMPGYPYSFVIRMHCGLTTYICQPEFSALNQAYETTGWGRFLSDGY
ncbi:MAG: hypothetical protein EZS26_003684 [Candidatus Ordinivivax streblomastigis]|uniref:Clostripain n=1 Tax=Candidatus Ordinivivax streblomastigis TaxID=2540710 RepID=A0A5M8NUY5_9BACT|nr:MAG: hypothetical protein EZS26_003684 [Candidatus Ordinivivax streblomastigis]